MLMYSPSFNIHVDPFSGMHWQCIISIPLVVALLLRVVARLSTWQRSLGSARAASAKCRTIQGDRGRPHVDFVHSNMDNKEDESKRVPTFDGKLDHYRDYRKRALLYFNGLEDSKQSLAGPRLISNLSGPAFECFRERDPAEYRNHNGVVRMLAVLDERFQFTPEQELSDKLEDLLFRLRRRRGEETTSFTTRFETLLAKTEDLISEEHRSERRKQQDALRAEYRRQSLDYMVARQQHQAQVAALGEGEAPPPEPVAPAPPSELPAIQPFRFPETMKGFLYLRHIGISLQTRSSLLRSSGGSLRYDKVAELLCRTELDALVASRSQGQGHSFWADGLDEEQPDEDDDDLEDDDEEDEYGGYAEGDESEPSVEEDWDDEEPGDEEYDTAMIGFLEARQKLLSLRKARGFREPGEHQASGRPGQHSQQDRDRREDRREGRAKSSSQGPARRTDFGWRDRDRDRDRERDRRRTGSRPSIRRPRTPPPTKRKGVGKGKGRGKSRSSGKGRRQEPQGSQFLGMAVVDNNQQQPIIASNFAPEFSFMAYNFVDATPDIPSEDPAASSRQCGFVSRHALRTVEAAVEECLALDDLLGLGPSTQACCLVTPPGYAILDTGCTSTLVGAENERLWQLELQKQSGGELLPERGQSDVKFEGINGETRASQWVRYPVRIGCKDGFVQASVIPGRAPFLLSVHALRSMKARLDCGTDTLEIPGIGKVPLEVNSVGHYLLPLLDFHSRARLAQAFTSEAIGDPGGEVDIERPDLISGLPPGLVEEGLDSQPTCTEDGSHSTLYVPKYSAIAHRTEAYAIGALLRLAKETKGPWIALPKELPAVYLILGKNAFQRQGADHHAWQVRAAQIGYKAKIIRRPPPQLKGAWMTILTLDDHSLQVALEWTECVKCVGRPVPEQRGPFTKWLFVFALPPACIEGSTTVKPQEDVRDSVGKVYTAVAQVSDQGSIGSGTECQGLERVPGSSLSGSVQQGDGEDSEVYFDCDEPVEVQVFEGSRCGHDAGVRALPKALHRDLQQRYGDHVSLLSMPSSLPRVQREGGSSGEGQWEDRICSESRLCSHSRAWSSWNVAPRRWRSHRGRRGRPDLGQVRQDRLSIPHPSDCISCSSPPCAQGSRDGSVGQQSANSIDYYQLYDPDSASDQGSDEGSGCDPLHDWYSELPAGQECPTANGPHRQPRHGRRTIRFGGHPANCPRCPCQGVPGIPGAARCDDDSSQDGPGTDHGAGGASVRAVRQSSALTPASGLAISRPIPNAGQGRAGPPLGRGHTDRSPEPSIGHIHAPTNVISSSDDIPSRGTRGLRSRFFRYLGGLAAALTATSVFENCVPTMPGLHGSDVVDGGVADSTLWPRVSPEVQVGPMQYSSDLSLPQAWKAVPINFERNASRARLREWLGPQGWKLDKPVRVHLIELYAGRARLSDEFESSTGVAIRLGRVWGQELRGAESRWLVRSLINLCKPDDIFVSFPCRAHCRWSQLNFSKGLDTRQKILRDRLASRDDLHLLFEVIDLQCANGRHVTAENPKGSLAWTDSRFGRLSYNHSYATFHQCVLGLRHPKSGLPVRKSTTIFTTRRRLATHMSAFRCNGRHEHDQLSGTYMGRSITAWAEDYPQKMARALVTGIHLPQKPSFGKAEGAEVTYEMSPRFESKFGHDKVVPAYFANGNVRDVAYTATPNEPTIYKVTDQDFHKQLNALQFPGRYKRDELPIPVQAQLRTWSGLEVDTVVTARHLKCYMQLPTAVVATRRTTLARVAGEWFYVDHCYELQGTKRLRLPVNCQLLVTFFGDTPQSQPTQASETQPIAKPVPGQQGADNPRKVYDYLQRLHVGLGHPGTAELVQHLRDAGAANWLLRQAQRFSCAVCDAHKPPPSHPVVGSAKPRSFNSIVSIDTLDLTLQRDSIQYRVFLLTAVDTSTSFARVFHLPSGTSAEAVQQFERGWVDAYGPPDFLFTDPDMVFKSEEFSRFLSRNSVIQRLSAAQSPWQHGQVERLHRTLRSQCERVFQSHHTCTPYQAATEVITARNELMRVEGVSPAVLVFGKLPKTPPSFAESDEDYDLLAERLHKEDPLYEAIMLRRVAARTAWVQSEVRDMISSRPRPYKGPYYRGQAVLVYRRRKGDAANPGHKGVWLGPGEIVAVESSSDKLVPRVIYVTVHGRLFLCSPEQLRPISLKAEWVRTQLPGLEQSQSDSASFQDMKVARGTDVRGERPTSAELEAAYEQPEEQLKIEELRAEADYEPLPQGPPTPLPGTPVPGTPVPGTPRPAVPSIPRPELPSGSDSFVVPVVPPTPAGGDNLLGPTVESASQVPSLTRRGDKRPPEQNTELEEMDLLRAERGPSHSVRGESSTVLTGAEQVGTRTRSRTPSRNPVPRATSFWAYSDFEGLESDHVSEGFFESSMEHDYAGMSIGLEFDVEIDELQSDESIAYILREMCWSAAAVQKRKAEVSERTLNEEEKAMFREAKKAEWSQWISNDVVELISRKGIDPRRVISSRWVLTWKSVEGQAPGAKKPKARLVIRGFRDPDLGEFSTTSPTLSRQGRHAVLTVAAHYQYRLFTLDAKTAFLSGDRSSRVKPVYAELPRDLVKQHGYDEDTIAKIKKVPYGLSEAPLAWYRRLTAELIGCGFEQVAADRCIYVLRDRKNRSRVLGVIGAHVDDLVVAGCAEGVDPQFEEAMRKLVSRLPFGDRKYADVGPVLYTGLNIRQHPQTREISVDQDHYIKKLREVPVKKLSDGPLDKQDHTLFWSQLGAILWVAVNTRPDIAYDVSHYASYGKKPEKQHLVALNKIVRSLQFTTCTLKFGKLADSWDELTLVVYSDAGHTSRPSGHSQAGTLIFWAPKSVLVGKEVPVVLADFSSSKIDRAVWSSYASELQAATIAADSAVSILLLYEQLLHGLKARDVKAKLTSSPQTRVLVTDNKGLYDSIQTEKPSTRQGQKMQSLVYQILYDLVVDYRFSTFWVNAEHMLADGLTKLSSANGRVDLIRGVMEESKIRITYCTVSGRKEKHELQQLKPVEPAGKDLESSIDV